MDNNDYKTYYRRNLPHYQPSDATFFVTFRLARSLPIEVVARLREEHKRAELDLRCIHTGEQLLNNFTEHRKRYFNKFDALLDQASYDPHWVRLPEVASVISDAMHLRDATQYDLLAYCIMPNHVHMVFAVERNDISLYRILQSLKRHTALQANRILNRSGVFWQHESYDHVVRKGDELTRIIRYVLDNPVQAGLVDSWEKWPWTYYKHGLR